jgi:hypothetical protein
MLLEMTMMIAGDKKGGRQQLP